MEAITAGMLTIVVVGIWLGVSIAELYTYFKDKKLYKRLRKYFMTLPAKEAKTFMECLWEDEN